MASSRTAIETAALSTSSLFLPRLDRQYQALAHGLLPLLLVGERGVGKAATARRVHETSRPGQPFVWVNCRTCEAELAVEIFGCRRDPARGQPLDRPGKLLLAREGTLFLDGIEDIPVSIQEKLLEAFGDSTPDVRLIATLKKPADGALPQAAWIRSLGATLLEILPLRERRDEIPHFCRLFFHDLSERYDFDPECLPDELIRRFQACHWKSGNLDALKDAIRLHFQARLAVSSADPV